MLVKTKAVVTARSSILENNVLDIGASIDKNPRGVDVLRPYLRLVWRKSMVENFSVIYLDRIPRHKTMIRL